MATPGHPKALLFKNYIYVVALAPDFINSLFLQRNRVLYYSFTTNLLFSLICIQGCIRALGPYYSTGNRLQPYRGCGVQIHVRSPRGLVLRSGATNGIRARAKRPRTAHNLRCNFIYKP